MTDHHTAHSSQAGKILTIRAISGLSGDMLVCGLAKMCKISSLELNELVDNLQLDTLKNCLSIEERSVHAIAGFGANVALPHEHAHRTLTDILSIIEQSHLSKKAKKLASATFQLLAHAEAKVHGKEAENVTFHEVGALDSILDICIASALFDRINPDSFYCSPLPLADGYVKCAHGYLPTPVPAVLQLLTNIPVCSFRGQGETITPTAIALLKSLDATFGLWPPMIIEQKAIIYGGKIFKDAPNGTIFALGTVHGF